jgi:hypothetical protein
MVKVKKNASDIIETFEEIGKKEKKTKIKI